MKNLDELNRYSIGLIDKIEKGSVTPQTAKQINSAVSNVFRGVAVQLKSHLMAGTKNSDLLK